MLLQEYIFNVNILQSHIDIVDASQRRIATLIEIREALIKKSDKSLVLEYPWLHRHGKSELSEHLACDKVEKHFGSSTRSLAK